MESSASPLSSSFHSIADVALATAAVVIAVPVCWSIYAVSAVVKKPLKLVRNWYVRDRAAEHRLDCGRS
jgi:hypothetical protein